MPGEADDDHGHQQQAEETPSWKFLASYPRQYVVNRLQPGEHITVDGRLDEEAWGAVNWTEPMEDIAQPFYPSLSIPV